MWTVMHCGGFSKLVKEILPICILDLTPRPTQVDPLFSNVPSFQDFYLQENHQFALVRPARLQDSKSQQLKTTQAAPFSIITHQGPRGAVCNAQKIAFIKKHILEVYLVDTGIIHI